MKSQKKINKKSKKSVNDRDIKNHINIEMNWSNNNQNIQKLIANKQINELLVDA